MTHKICVGWGLRFLSKSVYSERDLSLGASEESFLYTLNVTRISLETRCDFMIHMNLPRKAKSVLLPFQKNTFQKATFVLSNIGIVFRIKLLWWIMLRNAQIQSRNKFTHISWKKSKCGGCKISSADRTWKRQEKKRRVNTIVTSAITEWILIQFKCSFIEFLVNCSCANRNHFAWPNSRRVF